MSSTLINPHYAKIISQPVVKEPAGITAVRDVLDARQGKLPTHGEQPDRKQTGGEIAFNRIVYTGIGFGVNEVSSLWITDQFVHGKPKAWLGGEAFSKSGFDKASQFIAKKFNMPKVKASNALLMATLLSGGTLLVLPMRYLEEHKIYFTQKANHVLDWMQGSKKSAEEVQARDTEVAQAIACSPQQTWTSLLVGRAAAMATSWGVGSFAVGPERNKKVMDWSEKTLVGAANTVGLKGVAKKDTFKRYARLTGVETYSCALASVVLEVASKLFAKNGTEVHDPDICVASHEDTAAPKGEKATKPADSSARAVPVELDRYKKDKDCGCSKKSSYREQIQSEKNQAASATLAV